MASWSSRGPTDDGRIKPDVVAPGTWILSGYSDLYQQGYEGDPVNPQNGLYQWDGWGMPFNQDYKYMGGTSMSNPIAAGAATVVRDYYQKAYSHNASAALVKATLINSAVDLLDENNDGAIDNDFPIPNFHEGWGRVNVANATDGGYEYVDQTTGLSTGGNNTYQYSLTSGGSAFKVSLVWSDFPSTEAASKNLVNDLDLVVTGPGGSPVYRGNVFSGGWSQTGGSADRTNNVENVYVQSAASGTWTVQVVGFNVPNGPQPFALVVDGNIGTPLPTATPTNTSVPPTPTDTPVPPTATNTPEPGATMHVGDLDGSSTVIGGRWSANVQVTIHNGSDAPLANATVSGSWSNGTNGGGSCVTDGNGQCTITKNNIKGNVSDVTFTADSVTHASNSYEPADNHDPDGDSNGTSIVVFKDGPTEPTATPEPTSTPDPSASTHVGDLDGSTVSQGNRWHATVSITIHNNSEAPVAGATVNGSWSNGSSGSSSCVTNASGQCTVTKNNLRSNTPSVMFTVTSVTAAGNTYNASANHDPDGDSNGTSITVLQP
jgi:hypothetical protein